MRVEKEPRKGLKLVDMSPSSCVHPDQDKEQEGEAPERRAPIAEEGERDADHGDKPQHHPYIDKEVEEQDRGHTIPVDPTEARYLSLG